MLRSRHAIGTGAPDVTKRTPSMARSDLVDTSPGHSRHRASTILPRPRGPLAQLPDIPRLPRSTELDLLAFDFGDELQDLTGKDAIDDVLRSLELERPHALFRTADAVFVGRFLDRREGDGFHIDIDIEPPAFEMDCTARVEVHGLMFVLSGTIRSRDVQCEFSGPRRLFSLDRRATQRVSLPPGRGELTWVGLDELGPRPERATVIDLATTGVGILVERVAAQIPDSEFPAELRIGDSTIRCLAHASRQPKVAGQTSGVRIQPVEMTGGLIDTYLNERMPELVPRRTLDEDSLLHLMTDSGYLSLRPPDADFKAWHKLTSADYLTCDRVYRAKDGRLIGHVAATRLFRKTWLVHQLACRRDEPEIAECRKLLYLFMAAVPTLNDGYDAHLLAYFNLDLRWHELTFKRFVQWMNNDPAIVQIFPVDRFERDKPIEPLPSCVAREVRELREEEADAACALVRGSVPRIIADAWEVTPSYMRTLPQRRKQAGREVFVIRERGQLVGVALCDIGDPNVSLFNLVNMAKIFVRTDEHAPSDKGVRALLGRVHRFYAAFDILRPIIVAPPGTLLAAAEPGTYLAERMGCIVMTGRGIRLWENYCRFQFELRWPPKFHAA
jgi:hypothetical protein